MTAPVLTAPATVGPGEAFLRACRYEWRRGSKLTNLERWSSCQNARIDGMQVFLRRAIGAGSLPTVEVQTTLPSLSRAISLTTWPSKTRWRRRATLSAEHKG